MRAQQQNSTAVLRASLIHGEELQARLKTAVINNDHLITHVLIHRILVNENGEQWRTALVKRIN